MDYMFLLLVNKSPSIWRMLRNASIIQCSRVLSNVHGYWLCTSWLLECSMCCKVITGDTYMAHASDSVSCHCMNTTIVFWMISLTLLVTSSSFAYKYIRYCTSYKSCRYWHSSTQRTHIYEYTHTPKYTKYYSIKT